MTQRLTLQATISALAILLAACGADETSRVEAQHADQHSQDETGDGHNRAVTEEDHADVVRLTEQAATEAGIIVEKATPGPMRQTLSLPAEIRFDGDRVARVRQRSAESLPGFMPMKAIQSREATRWR